MLHERHPLFRDKSFIEIATAGLDEALEPFITGQSSYRVKGQAEEKPWGFEYRSPYWGGDPKELLQIARLGLRSVRSTLLEVVAATSVAINLFPSQGFLFPSQGF